MSSLILENASVSYPLRVMTRAAGAKARPAVTGPALQGRRVSILNNVWLSLKDGDRLAIIGRNGSGKSTLLRTMAGIYAPSTGRIWSAGVVAPIFSSSAGFVTQASGYENIFIRGMLLGMRRRDIEAQIDEISAFADIGDWIHQPMSTYSSGMALRVAFAITAVIQPNILLVDEWIGAGDALFMKRAGERLQSLIASANILVLASHSGAILEQFCSTAIVLNDGRIVYRGGVRESLAYYGELVALASESDRDARPDGPGFLVESD